VDEQTRAQLLAVFRDELADRLEVMQQQRPLVDTASEADARAAIEQVYRAAHTLKGAAQSVGEATIAGVCHTLEDTLGAARRSDALDRGAVGHAIDHALAQLRPSFVAAATTTIAQPEAARKDAAGPAAATGGATVRVDLSSLDKLGRAVQELSVMLASTDDDPDEREMTTITRVLAERVRDARGLLARSPELLELHARLHEIADRLGNLHRARALRRLGRRRLDVAAEQRLEQLDDVMRQLRLTSARTLRLALEQCAHEAARELGKPIAFTCNGEDVSVDREVLERVREPLTHLVRNAVDHGVEDTERRHALGKPREGRLSLGIRADSTEVIFTLADDGAGFDLEALARASGQAGDAAAVLQHAFVPGVSTREHATATSGRGLGLSIVRDSVAAMQGSVDVQSRPQVGTTIELRVPIQLHAVDSLIVTIADTELTIPSTAIDSIVRPRPEDIRIVEGGTWLARPGGELMPAVLLPLGGAAALVPRTRRICVVLGRGSRRVALWVDAVGDLRSVLVRPLGARGLGSPCVRAATIQTDGMVGLVLDVAAVLESAAPAALEPEQRTASLAPARVLVVDDSVTTRQLVRVVLESAGYQVGIAEDGEVAWAKLRGEGPFDLVVSDIDMPHLDGLGLLARVRATTSLRDLPVILVTALEQEEDRRRALDLGADAYVTKSSFDQVSLLDRIRDLLA
jgi:two-component system chemotaxis sensor kinase CheA